MNIYLDTDLPGSKGKGYSYFPLQEKEKWQIHIKMQENPQYTEECCFVWILNI